MYIYHYIDGICCRAVIASSLARCADGRHRYTLRIKTADGYESPTLAARYEARTQAEDMRIQQQARREVRMVYGHCGAQIH